ncbi:ribosome hibernation promotion factor [Candidatus Phycosocius bacilliformis]|uniref:Ribosome hibernation promoting factor n=1 Tax=Candidatus Phycosocius bacilliformis TaxID=1445552 RepID=A0A2P2EDX9_9PROT|nr:ribosome-associated translation inhibitor RaiA [Candidatus Phycosocius bacilliformis]GBF59263.1 ribosome hibernation promotion factor [Candidatus Phycosocius bacilliformis]
MGNLVVRVTGRNIDVGEALRGKIQEDLEIGVGRYVSRDGEAVVTLEKQRHLYRVEAIVHLDSGITLEAHGEASEPHAAFGVALEKIEKRVRRYKRRLKAHHARHHSPLPREEVSYNVIEPDDPAEDGDDSDEAHDQGPAGPAVIAETKAVIRTMPVATAVMQLELGEAPVVMFRNTRSGALNVVYRRADGNIGWIDPAAGVSG